MQQIADHELVNITGGAGPAPRTATPAGKPVGKQVGRPISQQELFNALMDPYTSSSALMNRPVSQRTLDAVRNMGVPKPIQ